MMFSFGKIIFFFSIFFIVQTSYVGYCQNLDAEVTVNKNPSEDYLFVALSFAGVGNLWIVDNDLTTIFYKRVSGAVYDFKYQPNGELTYNIYSDQSYGLDSSGHLVNQYFTPEGFPLDIHDLTVLQDGSYYALGREHLTIDMSQYVAGGDTAAILIAHTIHHMDANDNELWRWKSFDHYDILDADDNVDLTQHTIDWTHCNSIEVDTDGNIILSTRNFNEITKINRQTGEIIWRLGGKKNQFQFINDNRGFGRQHDARRHTNGNIILFDNGHYLIPEYSSYVEYELDENNLTATLVRRFTRDETIFTPSRGAVQELRNDNILISWGENIDPYITEINPQDSIEFELAFPFILHKYRAYRFPWQTNYIFTNTDSINFGTVSVGDSVLLNLWLINRKDTSAIINEFYFIDSIFSVLDSIPIVVPANDSVNITIKFEPYKEGFFNDILNIRYSSTTYSIGKQIKLIGQTTLASVNEEIEPPKDYILYQNFPNPFNPLTTFSFSIPQEEKVEILLYNSLGQIVDYIVNANYPSGKHDVNYDASGLSSGIYYYKFIAGDFVQAKKLVLIK